MTGTFYTNVKNNESDEFELIYYPAINTPSPANVRGQQAKVLTPAGGTKRHMTMFHGFNMIPLPEDALIALREPDSHSIQAKGERSVARVVEEFDIRAKLNKEVAISLIMSFGRVNIDATGNFLPPTEDNTSGALTNHSDTNISADFGIADDHRGNLTDATDGKIIRDYWSNSAAKISDQLDTIAYRARKKNTVVPTEVYINSDNKRWLRDNAQFKEWAQYNNVSTSKILRGETIDDLWGFNWHFVGGTWQDKDGTTRDLLPKTKALIVPKVEIGRAHV